MKFGLLTTSPFSACLDRATSLSVLMDSSSVSRSPTTRTAAGFVTRPARPKSSPSRPPVRIKEIRPSRLTSCLARCSAAGIRLVILAPGKDGMKVQGGERMAGRTIDARQHGKWLAAYRAFAGRVRQPSERYTWRILAVDRDDRVVGAIAGRFFNDEVDRGDLHVLNLLATTGPVFREHCEMAVSEVVGGAVKSGRTPGEISHWAVAPIWRAALVAVTLARAMGALASAFGSPVVLMAADNRRGEVNRLMRWGGTALGIAGRSCLPPFVHHESGAWLRLLVIEGQAFQSRAGTAAWDLDALCDAALVIGAK
jgi:hypothetical protein